MILLWANEKWSCDLYNEDDKNHVSENTRLDDGEWEKDEFMSFFLLMNYIFEYNLVHSPIVIDLV